jgi:SAM-dependent methyltransferase
VQFIVSDALRFTDPEGFDTIVSLETLKEVLDPPRLVDRLIALLRPGGVLVVSTPTTPSMDVNPHHLHDYTEEQCRRMVERNGEINEIGCLRQSQSFKLKRVIGLLWGNDVRAKDIRKNLAFYYLAHPRSFARRMLSTFNDGLVTRYVTIAWQKNC